MLKPLSLLLYILICTSLIAADQKTVAIVTLKDQRAAPWDPESVKSGITGSEEAVIYVSQKLADLGYKVLVLGNPPKNSPHSRRDANPRYADIDADDGSQVDIAIAWRQPHIGELLKKRAHRVYLWPHDTNHLPVTEAQIDAFDDVLWLSQYQREQWAAGNPGFARFTKIFGNGINPEQFYPIQERENPYSCIYCSNYARGLEVLLDMWPTIKQKFSKATLDIYYGWNSWGLLTPQKERWMRSQVDILGMLDVREHGLVNHDELNRALAQASFWTYPCIAPEVFCISAIRAQYAGCIPVIIDGSALKETVPYGFRCYKKNQYPQTLIDAMTKVKTCTLQKRKEMQSFIRDRYTWETIARSWKELFESAPVATIPKHGE